MCVCVWTIWIDVKLLSFSQHFSSFQCINLRRGTWHAIRDHVQRSYLIVWDTEPDQLCVPAFSLNGKRLNPRTSMSIFSAFLNFKSCTVSAICNLFSLFGTYFISIDSFCTQSELRCEPAHSGFCNYVVSTWRNDIWSLWGTRVFAAWVLSISC